LDRLRYRAYISHGNAAVLMALSGGGSMHIGFVFSLIINQSCTFFAMTIDHCSNDFSFIF
jgi:hypothetical protein